MTARFPVTTLRGWAVSGVIIKCRHGVADALAHACNIYATRTNHTSEYNILTYDKGTQYPLLNTKRSHLISSLEFRAAAREFLLRGPSASARVLRLPVL
jgi:hypothetical protein